MSALNVPLYVAYKDFLGQYTSYQVLSSSDGRAATLSGVVGETPLPNGADWWTIYEPPAPFVGTEYSAGYDPFSANTISIVQGAPARGFTYESSIRSAATIFGRLAAWCVEDRRFAVSVSLFVDMGAVFRSGTYNQEFDNVTTPYVVVYPGSGPRGPNDADREAAASFLTAVLEDEIRTLLENYDAGSRGGYINIPIKTITLYVQAAPPLGIGGGASLVGKNLTRASDRWIRFSPQTDWMCMYVCFAAAMNLLKIPKKRKAGDPEPARPTPTEIFEATRENKRHWTLWSQTVRNHARDLYVKRGNADLFPTHEADFAVLQVLCDLYDKSCIVYGTHFGELARFEPQDPEARLKRVQPLPVIGQEEVRSGSFRKKFMEVIELHYSKNHYSLLLPRKALTYYFGDGGWVETLPKTIIDDKFNFYHANQYPSAHAAAVPGVQVGDTPADLDLTSNRIAKPHFKTGHKVFGTDVEQRMRLLSYDTETYCDPHTGRHILYATGVAWWEPTLAGGEDGEDELTPRSKLFYGEDSFEDFLRWLASGADLSPERLNGSYLFAHNGGRYDITSLVNAVALGSTDWEFVPHKMMESNDRWISGVITSYMKISGNRRGKKRVQIKLRDSWSILPAALGKLGKDFKVDVLKGDIPHDRVLGGLPVPEPTPDDLDSGMVHWEHMRRDNWDGKGSMGSETYLRADCLCLLHIASSYNKVVFERWGFEVFAVFTAASVAKRLYLQRYHKANRLGMYNCSDDLDMVIRQGYIGGRCEAFVLGVRKGPVFYYDFTSLYPAVATGYLPGGPPNVMMVEDVRNKLRNQTFFGYIIADVSANMEEVAAHPHYLPLHGWYQNSRLIFGWPEKPIRMVLTSEAIKDGDLYMPGVYQYDIKWGIGFAPSMCMKDYFEDLFELKKKARANKQTALEAAAKITANSGYGWCGLKWHAKDSLMMSNEKTPDVYHKMLEERRLVNHSDLGDYQLMRVRKDVPHKSVCVQCCAWISDAARRKLFSLLFAIRKRGYRVFYCDTDSVMTDLRLSDHPEMLDQFCPDHASGKPGAELGSLKNELEWDEGFDMGVWNGCKYYALSRTMPDGERVTTTKLKGYQKKGQPKLTPEDIARATNNLDAIRDLFREEGPRDTSFLQRARDLGCIVSNSTYFSFSKSTMLDTFERRGAELQTSGWHIHTKKVTKLFRPIYNKGEIMKLESDGLRPIKPFVYRGVDSDNSGEEAPADGFDPDRAGALTMLAHQVNGLDMLPAHVPAETLKTVF